MAKPTPAEAPTSAQEGVQIPLAAFCQRLSEKDRRVELIAGFEHFQRAAGSMRDTDEGYRAKYAAFINAPA